MVVSPSPVAQTTFTGRAVTVAGVRFAGIGDPQFTPDRSGVPGAEQSEEAAGARLAEALREQKAEGAPVDVAIAHEPSAARGTDGEVPLVLAGHLHHEGTEVMKQGTRLRIEGSELVDQQVYFQGQYGRLRTVEVDRGEPGWHGGAVFTVTLPPVGAPAGPGEAAS